VYTSIDPALQRAAVAAIDAGAKNVDVLLAKRYDKWKTRKPRKRGSDEPIPQVQAAMVVLDSHTGEIKALIAAGITAPAS